MLVSVRIERFELSVFVEREDMSRLSVALPPLLAATWAPDAALLSVERDELSVLERSELSVVERFELSVVERSELSVLVVRIDMSRLSDALPPLAAATCAPDAPPVLLKDERSLLSVLVDMLRLSEAVELLLAATWAPVLEPLVLTFDRSLLSLLFLELLALSVEVLVVEDMSRLSDAEEPLFALT